MSSPLLVSLALLTTLTTASPHPEILTTDPDSQSHTPYTSGPSPNTHTYNNAGKIAGIVSIVVLAICISVVGWWFGCRKRKGGDNMSRRGVREEEVKSDVDGKNENGMGGWERKDGGRGWPGIRAGFRGMGFGGKRGGAGDGKGDGEWVKGGKWEELK